MLTFGLAVLAAIGMIVGLCVVLCGWFALLIHCFDALVAKDVLTRWDTRLATLPEGDREEQRVNPPVAVLDAILALPARRPRRFQLR